MSKFRDRREGRLLVSGSVRAFYKHVNSKICPLSDIPVLRHNNLVADNLARAQVLNYYFASVFAYPFLVNVPVNIEASISDNIDFSPDATYTALRLAKRSFSVGPDDIPSAFWANLASSLCLPRSV